MFHWIAQALGALMGLCYRLVNSYGFAILLFTLATKIVMLPLSVMQQKNSIKMVRLQPNINLIKAQYINDSAKAGEETIALYRREGYKPLLGLVPTLVQIPLIIGVINVVYSPLTYLLNVDSQTLEQLKNCTMKYLCRDSLGLAWQIDSINLLKSSGFVNAAYAAGIDTASLQEKLSAFEHYFFGFDLLKLPTLFNGQILIPLFAILSTLLLCVLQNKSNVLQKEQRGFGRWGTTAIMVALSAYLSFAVPAGAVLYWTTGNILAIAIMYLLNGTIDPKKHIDYAALEASRGKLAEAEKTKKSHQELKAESIRSKRDYKRFFSADNSEKELVFYSVKNGFYRYFKDVIEGVMRNSDIIVHYVTSDPNDEVFAMESAQFRPYYIDGNDLIYFFMKVDADIVAMTMPEIEKYYYKRSLVRKDIDYVYIFHAMVSTHMQYREGAFDCYDTIFCVGPHHIKELRETERLYNLPSKRLIEFGYPLLDDLRESCLKSEKRTDGEYRILIAPSHQDGNIMESCIETLLDGTAGLGCHIIVRPHPQYVRHNPGRMAELAKKYRGNKEITFETDFSTNDSLYTSDLLITDWSGIAMEFSFATLKPCVFINTPMKVLNPEYTKISCTPINIQMRSKIGISISVDETPAIGNVIKSIRDQKVLKPSEIEQIMNDSVFNVGSFASAGVRYIIEKVLNARRKNGAQI